MSIIEKGKEEEDELKRTGFSYTEGFYEGGDRGVSRSCRRTEGEEEKGHI